MIFSPFDFFIMENDYDKMSSQQKDEVAAHVARQKGISYRNMPDSAILAYHKEIKNGLMNNTCDETIEYGFCSQVNGHHYRTNRDDQINFIGQCQVLKLEPSIETVIWKTEDAGPIPLTRNEFFFIYKEGLLHKNSTIQKYWQKKMKIEACTTHAEIMGIKWEDTEAEEPSVEDITPTTPQIPEEPTNPEEPTEEEVLEYEQDPGEGEYDAEEDAQPEEEAPETDNETVITFNIKKQTKAVNEKETGFGRILGIFGGTK